MRDENSILMQNTFHVAIVIRRMFPMKNITALIWRNQLNVTVDKFPCPDFVMFNQTVSNKWRLYVLLL